MQIFGKFPYSASVCVCVCVWESEWTVVINELMKNLNTFLCIMLFCTLIIAYAHKIGKAYIVINMKQ